MFQRPFFLSIFAGFSLLSGCALAPNAVRAEIEHTSHLAQHLGARSACATPGDCGWETLAVEAHWQARGWFLDASEGYAIEPCDGLHEVFNARVGYEFQVRP